MNHAHFISRVQVLLSSSLLDAGFSAYAFYAPPETTFRKQLDTTWFAFVNYQYNEEFDVLDHREFFINVFRSPDPHTPSTSVLRYPRPETVNGRIYRKMSPWIPAYLAGISRADRPSDSWLYRFSKIGRFSWWSLTPSRR